MVLRNSHMTKVQLNKSFSKFWYNFYILKSIPMDVVDSMSLAYLTID